MSIVEYYLSSLYVNRNDARQLAHHDRCELQPERRKTERGRECPGLALLAGAHTDICLKGASMYVTVAACVFARSLGKETKMHFPCYGIFRSI
jgi:hypothetical protein